MPLSHLIHIPDREQRQRANDALLTVWGSYLVLPRDRWVLLLHMVKVLREHGITFRDLTEEVSGGVSNSHSQ
jgi:hypothetical protein